MCRIPFYEYYYRGICGINDNEWHYNGLQLPRVYIQVDMTRMYKHSVAVVGVGYGMVIVSGIVCVYYNIIITWTIYFFYHSLRAVLPWSTCDNQWNTQKCYIRGESINLTHLWVQSFLQSNASEVNTTNAAQPSGNVNETSNATKVTASEEFWQ